MVRANKFLYIFLIVKVQVQVIRCKFLVDLCYFLINKWKREKEKRKVKVDLLHSKRTVLCIVPHDPGYANLPSVLNLTNAIMPKQPMQCLPP